MIHVFIMRGGMFGFDGPIVSAGMDDLGRRVAELSTHIKVSLYNWTSYREVGLKVNMVPEGHAVVVIGYSGGGSRATWLRPTRPVDLMVLYDPSPTWQMQPVTNAHRCICFYNVHPFMAGFGGGKATGRNVEILQIAQQHLAVQYDQHLHDITLKAISRLE